MEKNYRRVKYPVRIASFQYLMLKSFCLTNCNRLHHLLYHKKKSESKSWICPKCKEENEPDLIFCPECGTNRYVKPVPAQKTNNESDDCTARTGIFEGKDNYYSEDTSEIIEKKNRVIGITLLIIVLIFIFIANVGEM